MYNTRALELADLHEACLQQMPLVKVHYTNCTLVPRLYSPLVRCLPVQVGALHQAG